ncbi:MAG TPA: SMC-Scp complex subunit ScpB [Candidatus Nanoarchaeia archaeon]|nr:SMC-Scp complex subunit ScpB [Candidatus Nanoarchaeia archaeon]
MSNLKYKLEALLFSSARSMKIDELASLTKAGPEEIRETLVQLKADYEKRDSSIILIDEGDSFKLNIKSEHIQVIQQIVTETELSKTLMETLAVIAFKYPIKQSDLIKIRTNKAYDHLTQLEQMGYIIRQKFGRSKLIKLTPKFFEYFDLPPEKLKEKFQDFSAIAKAIEDKEEEVKAIKQEIKRKAAESGKKEIGLVDDKGKAQALQIYDIPKEEEAAQDLALYEEKIGELEVVDLPEEEEKKKPKREKKTAEASTAKNEQESEDRLPAPSGDGQEPLDSENQETDEQPIEEEEQSEEKSKEEQTIEKKVG